MYHRQELARAMRLRTVGHELDLSTPCRRGRWFGGGTYLAGLDFCRRWVPRRGTRRQQAARRPSLRDWVTTEPPKMGGIKDISRDRRPDYTAGKISF